jgi:hypothetical protein
MKKTGKSREALDLEAFEYRTQADREAAATVLNCAARGLAQKVLITGPRGSGKSFLMSELVKAAGIFTPVWTVPARRQENRFVWEHVRGSKIVCLRADSFSRPNNFLVALLTLPNLRVRVPRSQILADVPLQCSFILEAVDDEVTPDLARRVTHIRLGRAAGADGNSEADRHRGEVRPVYSSEFAAELQYFLTEDFQRMQVESRAIPRTGSGTLTQRHKLAAAMDYNVTVSNWIDREWIKRTAAATSGGESASGIRLRVGDRVMYRRCRDMQPSVGTVVAFVGVQRRRRIRLDNGFEGAARDFTLVSRAGKGGAS